MSFRASILAVIVIGLLCLFTFASSTETQNIDFINQNDVPDYLIYAQVFGLVNSFERETAKTQSKQDKIFLENYFKKKLNLSEEQNQILKTVAYNFMSEFALSDSERKLKLPLFYKNELKNSFGEKEFNSLDKLIRERLVSGMSFSRTGDSFGAGGYSNLSLDEKLHKLIGISVTIAFGFQPDSSIECAVSATMTGPNVSVSNSASNDCSDHPRVTLVSTTYLNNSPYCINGTHTRAIYTATSSECTITPTTLTITNPFVSGDISNTSRPALLGADIPLQANAGGGTYEWAFTGQYTIVSGTLNSPAITIRSTDSSPIIATVQNTLNGLTITRSVTIDIVSPTLKSFNANQKNHYFSKNSFCNVFSPINQYAWTLGCANSRIIPLKGIDFEASITIPFGTYLTDLSKSGVKYVRSVSTLHKFIEENGSWSCTTDRTTDDDINTGWHLDSSDPVGNTPAQLKFFSENYILNITTNDSPAQAVPSSKYDAIKIDDRFEEYVVYFYGDNPSQPNFQKRIGSLSWRWGGLANYTYSNPPPATAAPYTIIESFTIPGNKNKDNVVSNRTYSSVPVQQLPEVICRNVTNSLDSSKFFVSQQYRDFLNREPSDDEIGFGRNQIASCSFDLACVASKQAAISREFFRHPQFVKLHPELDPALEESHDFNVHFIRQSYYIYLRKACEPSRCDRQNFLNLVAELDSTGDYLAMVNRFINLAEYRNRFTLP